MPIDCSPYCDLLSSSVLTGLEVTLFVIPRFVHKASVDGRTHRSTRPTNLALRLAV